MKEMKMFNNHKPIISLKEEDRFILSGTSEELDNFTSPSYSMDEIVRCRAVLKVQLRKFEGKAWKRL